MHSIDPFGPELASPVEAPASPEVLDSQTEFEDAGPALAQVNARRGIPQRAIQRDHAAILEMDVHTPAGKYLEARSRRAVRRGDRVYLPIWSADTTGLPTALLRSSLWSAGSTANRHLDNALIANFDDDIGVRYTGPRLSQYDRRVFAALLASYADRPLSRGQGDAAIEATFFELARVMGNSYTRNTHVALRASLHRQSHASLRIRDFYGDAVVPQLLDVWLPENYLVIPDEELKSSDKFEFRIPEEVAQLYGPTAWSEVPTPVLVMKSLRGWLSGFLATHTWPQTFPFAVLHRISGLDCRPNDFRARVCAALDELCDERTPIAFRVHGYEVSEGQDGITIKLAKWG
ncbi:hypothetical protein SNE35_09680 [Paucibacter sp. R3-3]|uniref:Replication protein n=1 Tax=Roseateles agri TaxID=3098619 RepID=A0ABU5DHS4_9BURK|nr:hypothetical protein [Paucibacter sp. R3-3]MDY0744779.1 hypothetical protein [Paucibacter sp. R3-3]